MPHGGGRTGSPVVALGVGGTATADEVSTLRTGLVATFTSVEANLVNRVFADTLPLVGNHLATESVPPAPARHYLTTLMTAIDNGLAALPVASTYTEVQVETVINTALTGAGITHTAVNLDASNATDLKLTMNTSKVFPAFATPLDPAFALPGLGLQLLANDPLAVSDAQVALTYGLNFGIGVDAQGFYLNTANNASTFTTAFAVTLPALDVKATLSKLRFSLANESAIDGDGVPATLFNGTFTMDLLDPSGADNRLRSAELGGVLLSATLTGNTALNLNLASDLGTAALPDIATDLNIAWGFTNAVVDPAVGISNFGTVPTVAFKKVSLGLGSFFSDFVDPVFGGVQTLTDPVQPFVDVLLTEIGFLSDLSGETVTMLDLAGGIGAVDPETAARLELYASLVNFINSVPTGVGNTRIDLGDYSLGTQDPRAAAFQLADSVPLSIRNAVAPGSQNGDLANFISGKNALPGGGMSFPILENPTSVINLLFGKQVDFFTYHVPGLDVEGLGYDEFYRIFGPFGVRLTATIEAHAYLDIGYDSSGLAQYAASGDEADIFNGFYVVDQSGPEAVFIASLKAFAAANILIAELGVGGGITGSLFADLEDSDFMPTDGRVHLGELTDSCIFELTGEISASLSAYLEIGIGPFSETFEKDFGSVVLVNFNLSSCDAPGMPGVVLAHNTGSDVGLHVGLDASLRQVGSLVDGAEDFSVQHVSGVLGSEVVGVNGTGLLDFNGAPVAPQNYTVGSNGSINAKGGEQNDRLTLAPDVLSPADLNGDVGDDRLIGGAGNDTLNGDAGLDVLVGGDGADHLNGGADQDFLDGQEGDDELLGGSASDILLGGPGADLLNGGPGFDTASYASATVGVIVNLALGTGSNDAQGDSYLSIERIVGSPFADIFNGSPLSDNFSGGDGNDVLDGKEGDDLLVGDAGADSLTGGPGLDFAAYTLSPSAVSVSLLTGLAGGGDAAGDTLATIENLQGSDFGDTLEGDNGPNWLRGLNGANTLRGNGGEDLLEGGKDNDLLEGGAANDTLRASANVDSLDPALSGGIDTLLGGPGNDMLYGDAGGDTLDGGDDDDQIFGGKDGDTISGGNGHDQLSGGKGNDTLAGGFGNDLIDGGEGDDVITLGAIRGPVQDPDRLDRASGGPGFDIVSADFSNQSAGMTVSAGQVNSLVFPDGSYAIEFENVQDFMTGSGNDHLFLAGAGGNAAANLLRTGPGNDEIYSGAGNDTVDAGGDDDIVEGGPGADSLDGGPGRSVLYYLASPQSVDVDLEFSGTTGPIGSDAVGDTIANFQDLSGSAFGDTLRGTAGPNKIMGRSGNDLIDGRGGDNELYGEDGNDQISAGVGNDTIFGGIGNDTINAGDGANVVNSDAGIDTITSGSGADNIHGGTENDTASSGAGDDLVFGEDGNDSLDGGIGSDVVDGGIGNDFLSVGALRGPVQDPNRLDHLFGGAGIDTITADFSNQSVPVTITAGLTQSLVFTDGTEARDFENVHDLFTTSGTCDDVLHLDGAADDGFGNLLKTSAGNDVIFSGRGSDNVDAGDGDDYVNGGANDTVLVLGGFGLVTGFTGPAETLAGGPGNDTLSFENVIKPAAGPPYATHYGVSVNLGTNATDGSARGVTISGFENITGTEYGDYLTGDDGPNIIRPLHGGGNSTTLGFSGPDRIDGKGGTDTLILDFSREDLPTSSGVTSNPATAPTEATYTRQCPASPFYASDQVAVTAVEKFQITGTSKNDQITGGFLNTDDILIGLGGNDTLGGLVGSDVLIGGEGNDVLAGQGSAAFQYSSVAGGHDSFDAGPGDDLVEDIALSGNTPVLGADALFQLEGGTGFDTLSVDFSNHPEAVVWSSVAPRDITFPDGAYAKNFEKLRHFASGSGNDSIAQLGRFDNIINTGGGDDSIAPGFGLDTVNAGAGANDLLILDYSADDLPTYGGLTGGGNQNIFRRDGPNTTIMDYMGYSGFERLNLVGTQRADVIQDFSGDDIISGGAGNDTITSNLGGNNTFNGGDGNDILTGGTGIDTLTGGSGLGTAEVDRLRGNGAADVFVLGDVDRRFYDDQSPSTPGTGAYASIEDFTPAQGDRLRLFGSASQYLLGTSPIPGTPGTALYHDSNGNAVLDPATDELIAILASPVTLTLANTLGTATFIQILDPVLVGLSAVTPAVANDGTGARFKLQFSISEPMTTGMFLEIQASTDLGNSDPWTTIASKTGNASWAGPANVTVSTPSGGKVVIAVSALQPVSVVGRQFFRFRLSNL